MARRRYHFIFRYPTVFGTGRHTQVNTILTAVRSALTGASCLTGSDSAVGTLITNGHPSGFLCRSGVLCSIVSVWKSWFLFMSALHSSCLLLVFSAPSGKCSRRISQSGAFSFCCHPAEWGRKLPLLYQYEARRFRGISYPMRPDLVQALLPTPVQDTDNPVHQGMLVCLFLRYLQITQIFKFIHLPLLWAILCIPITYGQDAGAGLHPVYLCLRNWGVHFTAIICAALPSPPFSWGFTAFHKMWNFSFSAAFI